MISHASGNGPLPTLSSEDDETSLSVLTPAVAVHTIAGVTASSTSRRAVSILAAAALGLLLLVAAAGAAAAQDNGDYTAKPVPVAAPPAATPAAVPPAAAATPPPSDVRWLAVTGSDLPGIAAIGAVLVAAGAGLLILRRRASY